MKKKVTYKTAPKKKYKKKFFPKKKATKIGGNY